MAYALVTGGSRGIGKAICYKLAQLGYDILLNYLNNGVTKTYIEEDKPITQEQIDVLKLYLEQATAKAKIVVTDKFFTPSKRKKLH